MDSLQGHSVPPPRILLLEDDPAIARTVIYALERSGLQVTHCLLVRDALQQLALRPHDLLVLDVGLPDGSGLDVCRQVRAQGATPVLMLSAHGEEIDRVLGLELGADDYVTKPFSPRELVIRIRKLIERRAPAEPNGHMQIGEIEIDVPAHELRVAGSPVTVTATEFKLLEVLASRCGRVQSRDRLLQDVWGYESPIDTRTVDTHMRRLREKLGDAAKYLETVRGVGYRFIAES